jgi:hypothetical protein
MNALAAIRAIRGCRHVYVAVRLFVGDDPVYLRISKVEIIEALFPAAGDGIETNVELRDDGDVYVD